VLAIVAAIKKHKERRIKKGTNIFGGLIRSRALWSQVSRSAGQWEVRARGEELDAGTLAVAHARGVDEDMQEVSKGEQYQNVKRR